MRYVSTRGGAPAISFLEVALGGLAPDGGLYMPERWPTLPLSPAALGALPYAQAAATILRAFAEDEIAEADAQALCRDAYASFADPAVTPLRQIGEDSYILELFHGPTLAFKDVAMQLIGKLFDWALAKAGERRTVVVATSGDTGGAAAGALAGLKAVDLFVLYPAGRISEVQRRFMTATGEANIHAIEVEGTFDDTQNIVKALLSDRALVERAQLSAVNSINWLRVAAQAVYYFVAASKLGRAPVFAVPTGNFGDAFAGYVAKKMGCPIAQFVIATNSNDILARALATGRYAQGQSIPTTSPAMDIQIASNFERLLFEACDRDPKPVAAAYKTFAAERGFDIPPAALARMRGEFLAASATDDEAATLMRETLAQSGALIDPHTAIGLAVAKKLKAEIAKAAPGAPVVTLSTAHPAKFPETVEPVTGKHPALPDHCADLFSRKEKVARLPAKAEAIAAYVLANARAARPG